MLFIPVFKAMRANKIKTTLVYLSLVVTISAIFLITAISHGIISMYSNILQSNGDIIITQKNISDTFFSNVDTKLIPKIKNIAGVKRVSALIVGASPVENLLESGSYPHEDEVIVGTSIYKQLRNKKEIRIADKNFLLSGAIFHKSASMLYVDVDMAANMDVLIEKIKSLSDIIDVKSSKSFVKNYNQFKIINKSSLIISLVAFVMGLIAIGSIMSITVLQRRDEFGIMKALGISSAKIASFIVLEGILMGVIAFISAYIVSEYALYGIQNIDKFQGYVSGSIDLHLAVYVFLATILMTILKVDPVTLIQRGN